MFTKMYIAIGGILAIILAIGAGYYFLVTKPIDELEKKNAEQKATMVIYEKTINEAYSKIFTMEQNIIIQSNQGYIDGKADENETVSSGSLDSLFTK